MAVKDFLSGDDDLSDIAPVIGADQVVIAGTVVPKSQVLPPLNQSPWVSKRGKPVVAAPLGSTWGAPWHASSAELAKAAADVLDDALR
jgi:hypothetical protein